tara:strand:+ start:6633 stop:6992 length:360 start_codon:yes stop_codon:yes gene_type:complete
MKPIGIIIWTEKITNLLEFYEIFFDSKVHKMKSKSAYFIYNGFRIYISEHSEIKGNSKDPNRMIINFETKDIEKEFKRLIDHGVKFIRKPEIEKWGGKVATFEDPDKNRINLIEQRDKA